MKPPFHTKNEYSQAVIAFAIVTYREAFYDTLAFISLVQSIKATNSAGQYFIFIYDNTDVVNWKVEYSKQDESVEVHYHHDSRNPGISVAYNYLAKTAQERGFEWVVFLDQDTELPLEGVVIYQAAANDFPVVPIKTIVLLVNQQIFSPSKYFLKGGRTIQSIETGMHSFDKFIFVNSGMMVQLSLFYKAGGYNERVKLDFADFLFLERVKPFTSVFQLLPITAKHSFSINELDITKALRRYAIFIVDLNNCPRHTFFDTFSYSFVGWKHLMRLTFKFKTLQFLKLRLGLKK